MFEGAVVPACLTKFEDKTFQNPNVRSQKIIETSELMIAIGNLKIQYCCGSRYLHNDLPCSKLGQLHFS